MSWHPEALARNVRQLDPGNWGDPHLRLRARTSQLTLIRTHAFNRLTEAQIWSHVV